MTAWPLLGVEWKGRHYLDTRLPFGLRSAPKILNALADALQWCVERRGVTHLDHYLDDYITIGPPRSLVCGQNLKGMQRECDDLGVKLATEKTEGPASKITFLGIEVDTKAGILRLPPTKLLHLRGLLDEWAGKTTCTKRDLQSILGSLNHACKVIRPGRSFIRNMLELLRVAHAHHHHIRLNQQFRADLCWWQVFAAEWNGVAIIAPPISQPQMQCTSDASGSWGCGACHISHWFQSEWSQHTATWSIAAKELLPILLASATWGKDWKGALVLFQCDNQAVVAVLQSRYSRDPTLMHLLRCLFFMEAKYQFQSMAQHVQGCLNVAADALSRNHLSTFFLQLPAADPHPSPVSPGMVDQLTDMTATWTSQPWTRHFATTVARELHEQQFGHTL